MNEHVMHPSAEIYGEDYARESFVKIEYQIGSRLEVIWVYAIESGEPYTLLEIPKATFDKFIAEYLTAHGETWIG